MSLGEKLYNLRKSKGLSQEEVADRLNVTRQTVSKWETGDSKPDFDKIIPICKLYNISTESLLSEGDISIQHPKEKQSKKRAISITVSIFLYFLSVITIILFEELGYNEIIGVCGFLMLCGTATCILVYQGIAFKKDEVISKNNLEESISSKDKQVKSICELVELITLIIYLVISFLTMAWHITWIIWLIDAAIESVIKLIYGMRDNND